VEPWYFQDASIGKPGRDEFDAWRVEQETNAGVKFYGTVKDVPKPSQSQDGEIRLVIISARTADNPKLLKESLEHLDCHAIYLEKPGAPTVTELEEMRDLATNAGVKVFLGFNKNVSSYLDRTRAYAASMAGTTTTATTTTKCDVTFLHNNNYQNTPEELAECFERNAEGMLKNMAIHELAILVTYYGVTVDNIAKVEADKEFSSMQTLQGPSTGKEFTDFVRLKFKIVTESGDEINVAADRCGGDDSVGIVTDASTGQELARFSMPDEETVANGPSLIKKYGEGLMPYFVAQDPDYLKLKSLVVQNCLDGTPADGVADIDVAIETLKVAEYLTPILQEQLR
jgi:predicted dehydrogenase